MEDMVGLGLYLDEKSSNVHRHRLLIRQRLLKQQNISTRFLLYTTASLNS